MAFPSAQSQPSDGTASQMRVVIVEDDFLVAMSVEDAVVEAGFTAVGVAATEAEALKLCRDHAPDFVTMDITLAEGGNGLNLSRKLEEELGTPSYFVSAYNSPSECPGGEPPQNALGWSTKPFMPELLAKQLREATKSLRSK